MDVNEIRLGHSGEYVLKLLVRVTLEFTYLFGEKAQIGLLLRYLRREYACRIFSKVAMKSLKNEIKGVNVHKFFIRCGQLLVYMKSYQNVSGNLFKHIFQLQVNLLISITLNESTSKKSNKKWSPKRIASWSIWSFSNLFHCQHAHAKLERITTSDNSLKLSAKKVID